MMSYATGVLRVASLVADDAEELGVLCSTALQNRGGHYLLHRGEPHVKRRTPSNIHSTPSRSQDIGKAESRNIVARYPCVPRHFIRDSRDIRSDLLVRRSLSQGRPVARPRQTEHRAFDSAPASGASCFPVSPPAICGVPSLSAC